MAASTSPPAARSSGTPLVQHPWRIVVVVVAFLVVGNLALVVLRSADTDSPSEQRFPTAIDSVSPGPGELVRLQDTVTADLRDGLTGVLVIDGAEVPEDQLDRVEPLGQVSFRPGPGKDLTKFEPGEHVVTVLFWPEGEDRPAQPGSYSWRFRAGA